MSFSISLPYSQFLFSLSLFPTLYVFFISLPTLNVFFLSLSLSRHLSCLYVTSLSLLPCLYVSSLSLSVCVCFFVPSSLCLYLSLSYVTISFLIPLSICLPLPLSLAAFFVGQGMAWSFAPFLALPLPRNSNGKGRFNTIGPLIKVSCLKKVNSILNIKSSWSKLVSTRRSTVLSLPL